MSPTAGLTACSLAPYDLAFIVVEISTFFTLVFGLTLLHILCCVYTPTSFSRIRPSGPTSLEALAFLALSYTLWAPISHVLGGLLDSIVFLLAGRALTNSTDVNNFYLTYQVEQTGLWELIDGWTINALDRPYAPALAIAFKVLLTWMFFEVIIAIEAAYNIISEIRAGNATPKSLLRETSQRWVQWVGRLRMPQPSSFRSDAETAWEGYRDYVDADRQGRLRL